MKLKQYLKKKCGAITFYDNILLPFTEYKSLKYLFSQDTVIDIGIGQGKQTLCMAKTCKKVIAFDIDENNLYNLQKLAKTLNIENILFVRGSVSELPFKNEVFDGLLMKAVLEHIPYQNQALLECKRISKKISVLIFIIPVRPWFNINYKITYGIWKPDDHINEHSIYGWSKLIKNIFPEFNLKSGGHSDPLPFLVIKPLNKLQYVLDYIFYKTRLEKIVSYISAIVTYEIDQK